MVLVGRDFDKDSKKYLFAILGFFYEFLLTLQIHCKNLKTNLKLCLGPVFCRRTPKKNWELAFWPLAGSRNRGGDRGRRPADFRRGRGSPAARKGWRRWRRPSHTCGYPGLWLGRPVAACPRRSRGGGGWGGVPASVRQRQGWTRAGERAPRRSAPPLHPLDLARGGRHETIAFAAAGFFTVNPYCR